MSVTDHRLLLLRHGETEWSRDGKHTSHTDLDLTARGREQAALVARNFDELALVNPLVISSPRKRALITAELAGLTVDEINPGLAEWDYGDYEGLTTPQIHLQTPDWLLWTHGCPAARALIKSALALIRRSPRPYPEWSTATLCWSATAISLVRY